MKYTHMHKKLGILMISLLIALSCKAQQLPKVDYPETRKEAKVSTFHGTSITDDYSWLDAAGSEEVVAWTKLQDSTMRAFSRSLPEYDAVKQRVVELMSVSENTSLSTQANGKIFYLKQDSQGGWGMYMQEGERGTAKQLALPFNPRAAFFYLPSPDAKYLALGLAIGGGNFDWKIYDVETEELLPEKLTGTDLGNTRLVWSSTSNGLYYVATDNQADDGRRSGLKVKYHENGEDASNDLVVFTPESDGSKLHLNLSDDNENLVILEREGAATAGKVHLVNTVGPTSLVTTLIRNAEASYIFLGNNDSEYYFQTDLGAPNGKVVSVDISKTTKVWKDVIPESDESMMGFQSAGGTFVPLLAGERFVIPTQQDLIVRLKIYTLRGELKHTVALPTGGLYFNQNGLNALSGNRNSTKVFMQFIGIKEPNTVFNVDVVSGKVNAFARANTPFEAEDYVSEIAFAESKDGTRIPISLTYKKGLKRDKKNPFMMQVYGAIAFTNYPYFQGDYIAWLEMGGVHAVAHIRGGGAYGSQWHKDGIARNKQNGTDDYIAAIEWAIDEKFTSPEKMVLNGVSAGTIPVGAVLTQRPDLVGAVVSHYGMLDMIGYEQKLGSDANHQYMVPEIGRASDKEDFEALNAYSPYQKIESRKKYPPVLALTSEMDAPLNTDSYKFIAQLQNDTRSESPMLLQMAWGSGHSGFGSQMHSPVDTFTDEIIFLIKVLDLDVKDLLKD